jgi:hypothetical protein
VARLRAGDRTAIVAAAVAVLGCTLVPDGNSSAGGASAPASSADGPYASTPNHPWNRVHRALYVRVDEDGHEEEMNGPDPPIWPGSTHLLRGPGQAEAIRSLEAFLDSNAASLVRDPVRRAVFQHDLWAVFDWLSEDPSPYVGESSEERVSRATLRRLLARAIGQVALSEEEIRSLPDNYALAAASGRYPSAFGDSAANGPVLPADLLSAEGEWVALESLGEPYYSVDSLVPTHAERFGWRSVFSVHLRIPGGRAKTLEYLERLASFDAPRVAAPPDVVRLFEDHQLPKPILVLNPETPQLPEGSAVALVRRMLLVDREGHPVVSPLVESLQIRCFRSLATLRTDAPWADFRAQQRAIEFDLDRSMLFAGDAGGLRAIGSDERDFETFLTKGADPFDAPKAERESMRTRHLERCIGCHGAAGIFSVQAYTRINGAPGTPLVAPAILPTARLRPVALADRDQMAVWFKSHRYEWGLLQTLLEDRASTPRGG